jgi:membrane-bound ClpP family serine protease
MVCESLVAVVVGLVLLCIGWALFPAPAYLLIGLFFTVAGVVVLITGVVTFFIPDIGKTLGRSG